MCTIEDLLHCQYINFFFGNFIHSVPILRQHLFDSIDLNMTIHLKINELRRNNLFISKIRTSNWPDLLYLFSSLFISQKMPFLELFVLPLVFCSLFLFPSLILRNRS